MTPRADDPVLSGAEVKALRTQLGKSQAQLGVLLGLGGRFVGSAIAAIERGKGGRHLTFAQAHLLLALAAGYDFETRSFKPSTDRGAGE